VLVAQISNHASQESAFNFLKFILFPLSSLSDKRWWCIVTGFLLGSPAKLTTFVGMHSVTRFEWYMDMVCKVLTMPTLPFGDSLPCTIPGTNGQLKPFVTVKRTASGAAEVVFNHIHSLKGETFKVYMFAIFFMEVCHCTKY
jgi:hypothetical protein